MSRWLKHRPPASALRDGPEWGLSDEEAASAPERAGRGYAKIRVRCPGCTRETEVVAAPWSPLWAKVKCRWCDRVYEARTRDSAMDAIAEEAERQDDVRYQRAHPKAFSKFARTRDATSSRQAMTKFGPAHIIGE